MSFEMDVNPGQVSELGLDSAADTDSGTGGRTRRRHVLGDDRLRPAGGRGGAGVDGGRPGRYRSTATADSDTVAPASDFAWFEPSPALSGDTAVSIASGPQPMLVGDEPHQGEHHPDPGCSGRRCEPHPHRAGRRFGVDRGRARHQLPAARTRAGCSPRSRYAGDARLGHYGIASAGPVSGPIVIRP